MRQEGPEARSELSAAIEHIASEIRSSEDFRKAAEVLVALESRHRADLRSGRTHDWYPPDWWLKTLRATSEHTSSGLSNPQVELVRRASDVIGPERFAAWLQTPVPSLNGQTPYSLLGSPEGREQVETVLGRIENGVY
jgi:hypothetical protein